MGKIPVEVMLLAIFALIVIVAILKGAPISLRVNNWFNLDTKKPSSVDVGRNIDVSGGQIGEAVGIKTSAGGGGAGTVTVLDGANARGAKIDRLVGIEESGGVGKDRGA